VFGLGFEGAERFDQRLALALNEHLVPFLFLTNAPSYGTFSAVHAETGSISLDWKDPGCSLSD
jgi:hypothetical protein